MAPALAELHVGDDPELWSDLGFDVDEGVCRLGGVAVHLTGSGSGEGIHAWGWRGAASSFGGGVATYTVSSEEPVEGAVHANSAVRVFYVVLFGPSWAEADAAMRAFGCHGGEPARMGSDERSMLRSLAPAGGPEIEVIGPPEHVPHRRWQLWGTIIEVADIDTTAAVLGDRLRAVKPAMQPGRRIATLDSSAGSSVAMAFISGRED